ncbi:RNA-dependent RNA polymerase [Euonymus yellow mottle associated virus]|uniref:RNA replication protein n=1 Tax=Euonymus yellow mottle associated virus TaxID=2586645 RepID=A0A4Y5R5D2_9VIRU|nr:RNA-dependent RNA polymerase [Euonymus yellow mottle associated virus]QCY52829.1 RNA-dependent RNA polymerase [Euonymus yellow mottle associated virus]
MSAIRNVFDKFSDPSVRAALQEENYRSVRNSLNANRVVNPYALKPEVADELEDLGIATNPFAVDLHPHAGVKAIENKLLETVGRLIPKSKPVTFLFLKTSKRNQLRRNPKIKDIFLNQHIEPRDACRYNPKTLVKDLCKIETEVAYISDTVHFFEPKQVADIFMNSETLETLYATMVLPPEAAHKQPSNYPLLYQLNYQFDGFQYIPGKHGGGAYHHEFKQLEWLKMGAISAVAQVPSRAAGKFTNVEITCQFLETLGANHLCVFRRGKWSTPRVRTFCCDDKVILPAIFHPQEKNSTKPLCKKIAMQMYLYCKSIKEVTLRDLFAKIRQLLKTVELALYSPVELTHICNYFYFIAHLDACNCYQDILSLNIIEKWTLPIKARIGALWERLTGASKFNQLLKLLEWQTFSYSLQVKDVSVITHPPDWTINPQEDPGSYSDSDSEDEEHAERRRKARKREIPTLLNPDSTAADVIEYLESTHATTNTSKDVASSSTDGSLSHRLTHSQTAPPQKSKEASAPRPWDTWAPILEGLGFKDLDDQFDSEHQLIMPITNIKKMDKDGFPEGVSKTLRDKLKSINREPVTTILDIKRASAFGSDVKNRRIGALLKQQSPEWAAGFALKTETIRGSISVIVIHGAGGSGKSQFLQEYLRTKDRKFDGITIVLPTNELRLDWEAKVPRLSRTLFKTFEKALIQPCANVVIFDDYTKLPAGYIEAYAASHSAASLLILTGDPRQSWHHEDNTQALTYHLEPASKVFSNLCRYYINATHRNCKEIANTLGVYSSCESPASITMSSQFVDERPILVPSMIKKTSLSELGRKAYTYAGCQGLTTPSIQIVLDDHTPLCSSEVMYTALSRAVDKIHFVNSGPNAQDYWIKLDSTPYLKTFIEHVREQQMITAMAREDPPAECSTKTHLPVETEKEVLGDLTEELPDKFERELFDKEHGHTNCVQTEDSLVQLFAHQQAKDEALLWKTIDARIRTSDPEANKKELLNKKDIGDILFLNFKRAMNLPNDPVTFVPELWLSCSTEVSNTYLSKPIAMLVNGSLRQSPDFDANAISLFLKSQWVKKTEKLGALKIKAGQTIASFMQETVMLYGTMARYLRRMREIYNPRRILINCETDVSDVSTWVRENWDFSRPAFANDFTAFDQSQDGAMLQFEVIKAKFFNVPEEIIEGYIFVKTHAKIFLGTLAIMRLTGEGPTFDANTECAIAYHHTKYFVPDDVHGLYAGDDTAQDAPPIPKPSFKMIEDRLELKSKELIFSQKQGHWAEFCGWLITPHGIIKDPLKLYSSMVLAEKIGKVAECKTSYALDLRLAYSLGDTIQEVLSSDQLKMHQLAVRKIHQWGTAHLLEV